MTFQTSLFNVDDREFRIRRKGHGRLILLVVIIYNIRASALFVRTQNQPDVFI